MKREAIITAAICLLAFVCASITPAQTQERQKREESKPLREVVVTFDDLPFVSYAPTTDERRGELTTKLLHAVSAAGVPAIGFVNERQLHREGVRSESRVRILKQWVDAGLELGNHTYSHPDLHTTALDEFKAEVIRGEEVTRELLRAHGKSLRFFRHPFLHTGRDLKTKTAFEQFLRERGYQVAPVTIDNNDYIFARAYGLAKARGDEAATRRIVEAYMPYMEAIFAYYEQQSDALFGRAIPHVLLLHANELNADTFHLLAKLISRRGYRFITLERALADSSYRSPDTYIGAGGISWLHRWALTVGKRGDFFKGEPEMPEFVVRAASAEAQRPNAP